MKKSKIALVTGGTSGVGKSLMSSLVKENYFVYFIGTNAEKGKSLESAINQKSKLCEFVQLDLSNLTQVKEFAENFLVQVPKLDILLNIAGVLNPKKEITKDGLEQTFTIGYLSSYLLSTTLIPSLSKSENSRIISIGLSPKMLIDRKIDFSDLNFEKAYNGQEVLKDTLHAKAVMTDFLSESLKEKGIEAFSFNPGPTQSGIGRKMAFPLKQIFWVVSRFFPKESKTALYVSSSNEVQGKGGSLFDGKKPIPLRFDAEYKTQLKNETENLLGKVLLSKSA